MSSLPEVTVFTATVYPDVARLWYECVRRAFPPDAARFEIFYDAEGDGLPSDCFEGVHILRRTPDRRDHHDAYNDAVHRATTRYLAIIDTDVFWTIYRRVLEKLPGGFYPGAEFLDPRVPLTEWRWFDTGDILTQAVIDAGHEVELLHLDKSGQIVRFYGITLSRRGARNFGPAALSLMAGRDKYFWRGYVCNLVLQRVYQRVFPNGPRYDFPFRMAPLVLNSLGTRPSVMAWRYQFLRRILAGKRKVEDFLLEAPLP
jgi:ribulose bisphosphate carboxylase small subunit